MTMIEFLRLLTLDFLVNFRSSEPAGLVTNVFNFGPGQIFRRTLITITFRG